MRGSPGFVPGEPSSIFPSMRMLGAQSRGAWVGIAAAIVIAACSRPESDVVRGRGLSVASIGPASEAAVYSAAARAAFDLRDESLSLLLDRRILPRAAGLSSAGRIPNVIVTAMRRDSTIKGLCEPPLTGVRGAPRCTAVLPGYILRFSPVLRAAGDTTEVYLFAQKYDNAISGFSDPLRFERAYLLVPAGPDAWRAVKEGKVAKEVRGEGR